MDSLNLNSGPPFNAVNGWPFSSKVIVITVPAGILWNSKPSFASILARNLPPTRRSFSANGECQSSDALFHFVMCSGDVQYCHTFSTGAFTVFSTVIFVACCSIFGVFNGLCDLFLVHCKDV